MDKIKSFALGLAIVAVVSALWFFVWWAWPYTGYAMAAAAFAIVCHGIGDSIRNPSPPRPFKVKKF